MREFIVRAFSALMSLFFLLFVAAYTAGGYFASSDPRVVEQVARITNGRITEIPAFAGAGVGLVAGLLLGIFIFGIIFTLIDMRVSLDRIADRGRD